MIKETVKLNYLHIAPRKVRLIGDTLKGLPVNEAEAQLYLRPQRASKPLLKLLRSAIANVKHNRKTDPDKLVVENVQVNPGPILKRFIPRAMGRATPINRRTSHVVLTLKESEKRFEPKFNVTVSKPKVKKERKTKKTAAPKTENMAAPKTKERVGFLRKMFRRKSV